MPLKCGKTNGRRRGRIVFFFRSFRLSGIMDPGGHFTIGSYGGVRCKNFCYDPIPEYRRDFETQSQNMGEVSDKCFHYKTIVKLLFILNLTIPRISSKN